MHLDGPSIEGGGQNIIAARGRPASPRGRSVKAETAINARRGSVITTGSESPVDGEITLHEGLISSRCIFIAGNRAIAGVVYLEGTAFFIAALTTHFIISPTLSSGYLHGWCRCQQHAH